VTGPKSNYIIPFRNYCGSELCPSSGILNTRKHNAETGSVVVDVVVVVVVDGGVRYCVVVVVVVLD
jgi:hypothetical protein